MQELSPREREVLGLVGAGLSNPEIAARLHLVEGTVKADVSAVLDRLGVRNRVRAAIVAYEAAPSLAACPPPGDWSFPSNHATIAGAAAVTLALVRRTALWLTAPLALLMASSRVFVGVHYPHDVAAGLALGAAVAFAVVGLCRGPAARSAAAMRAPTAPAAARWSTGPGSPLTHAESYGPRR
ncbi:phosphatase PAP2 family protein [Streptomyces sp. NPDC058676]|uniref:phosphatase PAP2 family protein n=1 Tax=unclassified Streptomyces TaxID=2593676 RepID=UPI003653F0AE